MTITKDMVQAALGGWFEEQGYVIGSDDPAYGSLLSSMVDALEAAEKHRPVRTDNAERAAALAEMVHERELGRRDGPLVDVLRLGLDRLDRQGVLPATMDVAPGRVTLSDLRAANTIRQREWCPDPLQQPDLMFRATELGGEVGEAVEAALDLLGLTALLTAAAGRGLNLAKKLQRERQGWRGTRTSPDRLMDELADVVICADLLAVQVGGDLDSAVQRVFNRVSEARGLKTRLPANADG